MKRLLKNNLFVFLLIVLVSVAFKATYLDYSGLWHDEAFSLYFAQQHWGHLKHISEWNCNPPLYYYFLWIWEHLFGTGEYAVRFSSVLFSALSAGMIYLLCARHFDKRTGWIAVLFYLACNELFYFSHEARPHAMVIFLVLTSSLLLLELMRKPGWIIAIALGVINFGIVYLNYTSGFFVLLQALVLLFYFDRHFLRFYGLAFGIALLLSAMRFTPKTLALLFEKSPTAATPQFFQLPGSWFRFFNGPDLFFIFLCAAVAVLVQLIRDKEWKPLFRSQRRQLLCIWLIGFGTTVVCFFLGYVSSIFMSDVLIFAAPFVYISMGWLIEKADTNIRYPLLALVSVFILFSFLRIDLRTTKPMDYRGATELVKSLQRTGATTLVETRDMEALFSYYYDRNAFTDFGNVQGRLKEKRVFLVNSREEAQAADVAGANQVILTQTFEQYNPENAGLEKYLSENFRKRVRTEFYRGVTITLYSK